VRDGLWTDRTVAWYEAANARSDYADKVLAAAAPLIADAHTALDVGAGFGALAVPLARRLQRVTALEPAPAMAAALRRSVRRAGLDNVAVIEAVWGQAAIEPHDVVVCAHVGPLLGRGSSFLRDVAVVARVGVVLVRDAGGDDKFYYPELYPRLLGRSYGRSGKEAETVAALSDLRVSPVVAPVEYHSDQPFASLEEACDFWMTYMALDGAATRGVLRAFLAERLQREGDGWVAPFTKRGTVMWWRV
jgi:SAM-dependent methyltransferase